MEHRRLGESAVHVSRVILGCANFGGIGSSPRFFGQRMTKDEAFATMDAAWELGITTFDTADAYGGGRSETFIGEWLATKGVHVRDRIVLTTKTFRPMDEGHDHGLTRARILRQVDASLLRLGVDRIALYLSHDFDPDVPQEATLGTFEDLIRAGKLGAVGASNFTGPQLAKALEISTLNGVARYEWVQNEFSLLEQTDSDTVFPLCREHNLGYTPYSPLAGGWLAGNYRRGEKVPAGSRLALQPEWYECHRSDPVFNALEVLAHEAAGRDVSLPGLALAWTLSVPEVTAVLVGPRRVEHLGAAAEANQISLTTADCDRLSQLFTSRPHPHPGVLVRTDGAPTDARRHTRDHNSGLG
jgi:aryl-alcohol dehydrogenase-like predicted oxidoreductase